MHQPPDRLPLAALENAHEAQRGGGTPSKNNLDCDETLCAMTPSPSKQGITPESVQRNAQAVLAALDQVSSSWMWLPVSSSVSSADLQHPAPC